ncbi:MAG: hypothetical protein CMQ21_03775 [Gammaproteobacteria bacterium]|nr:hypothetical protein [Gammaproteobacteria bacterium]
MYQIHIRPEWSLLKEALADSSPVTNKLESAQPRFFFSRSSAACEGRSTGRWGTSKQKENPGIGTTYEHLSKCHSYQPLLQLNNFKVPWQFKANRSLH